MKILVLSDSHGYDTRMMKAIEAEQPFDLLFHLGDIQGSELKLQYTVGCPLLIVRGNCDGFSDLKDEIVVRLPGGHRALLTHGNRYSLSSGYGRLLAQARKKNCDLVFFGHTHRPLIQEEEGILLLNPGSISLPRTQDRIPSYMLCRIGEDGIPEAELKYIADDKE